MKRIILVLIGLLGLLMLWQALARRPRAGAAEEGAATSAPALRHPWLRRAVRAAIVLALAFVLFSVLAVVLEDRIVFVPQKTPLGGWDRPDLGLERCWFATSDGVKLHAWWHPGRGAGAPVLLFCHGNAGNMSHRTENLAMMVAAGAGVLIFDYRGYGLSEGRPTERGVYLDAEAACRYLTEERGVAPRRIVCFGRSLGAAVALHVALEREVAGLVMESAFASVPAMARRSLLLRPFALLARNHFDNAGRVGGLRVPVLCTHGGQDRVVPVEQGRAVFAAAPEPKTLHVVADAGHEDVYVVGGEAYWDELTRFLQRCTGGQ